jgi:hypothetical protein
MKMRNRKTFLFVAFLILLLVCSLNWSEFEQHGVSESEVYHPVDGGRCLSHVETEGQCISRCRDGGLRIFNNRFSSA